MAQTASPSPDQSNPQSANPQLVPPDESLWQRYSPHAEFSLSSAGSLAIHILIFGLLGLMAWLGAALFSHANRSLPVEAVRFAGGGGKPQGQGDASNNGAAPVEEGAPTQEDPAESAPPEDKQPPKEIKSPTVPKLAPKFEDPATRALQQSDAKTATSFQQLRSINSKIRFTDSKPSGRGQGGPGSGGGSGDGQGSSVGNGRGEGRGNLTPRERRMARWTINVNKADEDYLRQIQDLGGILAVPIREHAKPDDFTAEDYRLIRNLSSRPPKLLKEDMTRLGSKYNFYDNNPTSAALMMRLLGLSLRPSHFIAVFPVESEEKLFKLENAYMKKHHPGRTEDDIEETIFEMVLRGKKYEPKVAELKLRK